MPYVLLLLTLFATFFKIGLFTFGGGYAMIPLMLTEVVDQAWLTYDEVINFIAIAESTPGPFAINMATFVGTSQAGILGALVATTGVILPSFIIITLIAAFFHTFSQNRFVQAALKGMRPVIIGLIGSAGLLLILRQMYGQFPQIGQLSLDKVILMFDLALIYFGYQKVFKRPLHPIILIVISAILGMLIFR